jgi:hypothetical protein
VAFEVDGLHCGPLSLNVNRENENNRRLNLNGNNRSNNVAPMVLAYTIGYLVSPMKTYRNLYTKLCSYENLYLAFIKARKRKSVKSYVIDFESNLDNNLLQLKQELENLVYSPAPLTIFIIKDPKTRKISASHFRDRVVHHALCNIIAPIFEQHFIYDSFANQKLKGTHSAIRRFEEFMRKVHTSRAVGESPEREREREIINVN